MSSTTTTRRFSFRILPTFQGASPTFCSNTACSVRAKSLRFSSSRRAIGLCSPWPVASVLLRLSTDTILSFPLLNELVFCLPVPIVMHFDLRLCQLLVEPVTKERLPTPIYHDGRYFGPRSLKVARRHICALGHEYHNPSRRDLEGTAELSLRQRRGHVHDRLGEWRCRTDTGEWTGLMSTDPPRRRLEIRTVMDGCGHLVGRRLLVKVSDFDVR